MATNDKMPDGIKIETNSGMTIYDSSWITGVDYDNDHKNMENDSTYSDGYDNSAESEEEENFDEMDPQKIAELLQEDVVNNEDNRPNNEEIEAENNTENNENNENNQNYLNVENNQNHPNVAENEDPEEEVEEDIEEEEGEREKDNDSNPSENEESEDESEDIKQPSKTTCLGQSIKPIHKVIKKPNTASKLQRSSQML
jgi:hypothetical protein